MPWNKETKVGFQHIHLPSIIFIYFRFSCTKNYLKHAVMPLVLRKINNKIYWVNSILNLTEKIQQRLTFERVNQAGTGRNQNPCVKKVVVSSLAIPAYRSRSLCSCRYIFKMVWFGLVGCMVYQPLLVI